MIVRIKFELAFSGKFYLLEIYINPETSQMRSEYGLV